MRDLAHLHASLGGVPAPADAVAPVLHYGDAIAEHDAVRNACGLIDLSSCGVVQMRGAAAPQVLNGVLSNDTRLDPGTGCYACLLNDVGRVRAAMHVLRTEDGFLILTGPGQGSLTVDAIDYYIFTEDAAVEDVSAALALFSLQGPQAASLLARLAPEALLPARELEHATVAVGEVTVRVVCHSRTGEPGYDLLVAREQAAVAFAALLERGARPVGQETLDMLRVEAGIPAGGVDISEQVNPLEAGILGALSFDKGCYLGQETIARITFMSRPARRLAAVLADPPVALPVGARLFVEAREVGWVTSTAWSPCLGRSVSLGYVRHDALARALRLRVVHGEPLGEAELRELPLVRSPHLLEPPVDAVAPPLEAGHKPKLPF